MTRCFNLGARQRRWAAACCAQPSQAAARLRWTQPRATGSSPLHAVRRPLPRAPRLEGVSPRRQQPRPRPRPQLAAGTLAAATALQHGDRLCPCIRRGWIWRVPHRRPQGSVAHGALLSGGAGGGGGLGELQQTHCAIWHAAAGRLSVCSPLSCELTAASPCPQCVCWIAAAKPALWLPPLLIKVRSSLKLQLLNPAAATACLQAYTLAMSSSRRVPALMKLQLPLRHSCSCSLLAFSYAVCCSSRGITLQAPLKRTLHHSQLLLTLVACWCYLKWLNPLEYGALPDCM